jgi:uncharacterized protein
MKPATSTAFPDGLLRPQLYIGIVTAVSAAQARVNLSAASDPSGSHFESQRYGRGEVGELVLIEGQVDLVLGRLTDVRVPESDRRTLAPNASPSAALDVFGFVQFLGTVRPDTLRVAAGVANYPRLGDRVYAAPHSFVGQIPNLLERDTSVPIELTIGAVSGPSGATVRVRPEKLFGRHCAILGATGGGKSWTVARIIEECAHHRAKIVLLDATSEYRPLKGSHVTHFHVGSPIEEAPGSQECSLPAHGFQESDFMALFEPSGKVQGPRLRDAIRSLRLVRLQPSLADDHGLLVKANQKKEPIERLQKKHSAKLEDPATPFNPTLIARQIMNECVYPNNFGKDDSWGSENPTDQTFCIPLASRVHAIVRSAAFNPVFKSSATPFDTHFEDFLRTQHARVMRLCLGGVSYEYRAREFIVNTIGRSLLNKARTGRFRTAHY